MDDGFSPKSAKALLDDDKSQGVDKASSKDFFAADNSKSKAAKFESDEKDTGSLIPAPSFLMRSESKHYFKDHPILNRVGICGFQVFVCSFDRNFGKKKSERVCLPY